MLKTKTEIEEWCRATRRELSEGTQDQAFYLLPMLEEAFNHGRNYEKADRAERKAAKRAAKKATAYAHMTYAK